MAPVMAIQGRMEHMARASRQFLENAKARPVRNVEMKWTVSATFSDKTFSDKAWCTKSGDSHFTVSIFLIYGG
jgi:hypothetical protein